MDSGRANNRHDAEATGEAEVSHGLPATASICREGEYWTVSFAGSTLRLRDSKGLAYLAQLVRYPEHSFHALDLVTDGNSLEEQAPDARRDARARRRYGYDLSARQSAK